MKKRFILLPPTLMLLFFACTPGDDIAGSKGGSETTNGIVASIEHSDGTPAAGATVRLRRSTFVSTPARLLKSRLTSADIATDLQGRIYIQDIEPGSYYLEVADTTRDSPRGEAVLLTCELDSTNVSDIGTFTLRPFATITGYIDSQRVAGREVFVQIRGLERLAMVNSSGTFSFNDLPAGNLDIRLVEGSGTTLVERASVNVNASAGTSVKVLVETPYADSGTITLHTKSAGIPATTTLYGFPLLVRLDESTFDFSSAPIDGSDIQFTKTDGTPLPFEVELWDAAAKKAAVWVRTDTIRGSETAMQLIMKWGATTTVGRSQGGTVFDTARGFAGVWHLGENPDSGASSIKDHTVHEFNGTPAGAMTVENRVAGMIGDALWFDGDDDYLSAGRLNVAEQYSLSCWVRADNLTDAARRFIWKEYSFTLWYDAQGNGIRVEHFTIQDSIAVWRGIYQDNSRMLPLDTAKWYYLAGTYDSDKIRLYINGECVDSTNNIGTPPVLSSQPLSIGGRNGEYVKGIIDEVRIENRARSPEWIRLCYQNQKENNPLVTFKR